MHFWIDKRSSYYGIGHNRSMAGMSYQHRRARSKSLTTVQARQHSTCLVPPSIEQTRAIAQRNQHQSSAQNNPSVALPLNAQHIPVIHSVYNRTLPVNLQDSSYSRSSSMANLWIPILKSAICISLMLLAFKLYYDNYDDIKLLYLLYAAILIILIIISIVISTIRIRRSRHLTFTTTAVIESPIQATTQSNEVDLNILDEPPPPYAIAVRFPEKAFNEEDAPPPYEKINIM